MIGSLRNLALGAAVAATTLAPLTPAQADHFRRGDFYDGPRYERVDERYHHRRDRRVRERGCFDDFGNYYRSCDRRVRVRRDRDNLGAALAVGALGIIAGAVIVDSLNKQKTVRVAPDYPRAPRRRTGEPRVITYDDIAAGSVQPWSPAWFDYCENRYRSFNPDTGTYRGYDGKDHFCQAR